MRVRLVISAFAVIGPHARFGSYFRSPSTFVAFIAKKCGHNGTITAGSCSQSCPKILRASPFFCGVAQASNSRKELIPIPLMCAIRTTVPFKGAFAMDPLQQELERLLGELAELDRCSARSDAANLSLITIARRGTNLAIAEVRSLMARRSSLH